MGWAGQGNQKPCCQSKQCARETVQGQLVIEQLLAGESGLARPGQVTGERLRDASLFPRGRQAPAPALCGLGSGSGSWGRTRAAFCGAGRRGRPGGGRRAAGRGGRGTGREAAGRNSWPPTPDALGAASHPGVDGSGNSASCPCPPAHRPAHFGLEIASLQPPVPLPEMPLSATQFVF